MRDSLSVLDQLIAGAGDEGVTYALAASLLGYTDESLLDDVVDAFAAGDGAAVFNVVDRVVEAGHDPRRFAEDLLERLRDLIDPRRRARRRRRAGIVRGARPTSSSGCAPQAARFGAGAARPAPPTSSTPGSPRCAARPRPACSSS